MAKKKPEFNGTITTKKKEQEYEEKGEWSSRLDIGSVGSPGIIYKEKEKRNQSEELNKDIEEFLAKGGTINNLDH